MFGKMSTEQWVALNCRHAELHFSFVNPPGDAVAPPGVDSIR